MPRSADRAFAPIALFVYRRPRQTLRLLESLASNPEAARSDLWVFCEGPKSEAERNAVDEVRRIVKSRPWAKTITVIEHAQNLGCSNSMIAGINAVLEKHDRVVVIEDDLLLSPHFLSYMNEGLTRYEDIERVMQVCGYMFPIDLPTSEHVVLLPYVSSWGWATWRRAWSKMDPDMSSLSWLDRWRWRRFRFDLYGAYPFRKMIDQLKNGEIDTWDIQWYLSFFRNNGLAAYPAKSLVVNDGFVDGTHVIPTRFASSLTDAFKVLSWPNAVRSNSVALRSVRQFYEGARPLRQKVSRFLRNY